MSEVQNVEGKEKEDWMQQKWRPAMGWLYMAVCAFDFMIAPILWSIVQAVGNGGHIESQWQPLTLQGAGLFHVAMGAVLGIAAFGRTQEKMAGAAGGNGAPISGGFNNAPTMGGSTFNQTQTGGFNSTPPAFGSASSTGPSFAASTPAPTFGSSGANCPTTGKPLGPNQSFPAL
jgi:hypothetical protein